MSTYYNDNMNFDDANPPEESSNRTFLLIAGVLGGLVLLEEAADVEVGGGNGAELPEQQGHEHAADAAVAVFEGVERLEFHMADRHPEQSGPLVIAGEIEPAVHAAFQLFGGDGNKADVRAAAGADVVLLGLELAGVLGLAPGEGKQELVHLPDKGLRQRSSVLHLLSGRAQCPTVEIGLHRLGAVFIRVRQVGIRFRLQLKDFLQGAESAFHP